MKIIVLAFFLCVLLGSTVFAHEITEGYVDVRNKPVPATYNGVSGKDIAFVTVDAIPVTTESIDSYRLMVKNTSKDIISVEWGESSILYNCKPSLFFVDGQKYTDVNNPMPSTIIPPQGVIVKSVYGSEQVDGTYLADIPTAETSITVCLKQNEKPSYYMFSTEKCPEIKDKFSFTKEEFKAPKKKTPVKEGNFEVVDGKKISEEKFDPLKFTYVAIKALIKEKNDINDYVPGVISYRFCRNSAWNLNMRLCYDEKHYWFEYVSSDNLGANPKEDKIHRNYKRWIKKIEKQIEKLYQSPI